MKRTKRIICALLALLCCFSMACAMISCDEENGEGDSNLFFVNYKNIRIELDKSADDVLDKLGEPQNTINLGNCGGIGVQTKYVYNDISICTLKEKDGEKIHKIAFENDFVSTNKGIYIGSAEESVSEAYGEPKTKKSGKWIYEKGSFELEFEFENAKVSEVELRRIVIA